LKCSCGFIGESKIVKTAALENETDPAFEEYLHIEKKMMIPFIARICPVCGLLAAGEFREKEPDANAAIFPCLISEKHTEKSKDVPTDYRCGVNNKFLLSNAMCVSEDWPKCRNAYANKVRRRNYRR
jgi:hypothetical protein